LTMNSVGAPRPLRDPSVGVTDQSLGFVI
jgi:hypothetical protein